MSSARGAAGAGKPKLHNVNNVYSGKNSGANRATAPSRYGLQSIGKASVVRRMPPPASLPSLKSECNGSNVTIIPAGSTGWNKANTASDTSIDIKVALLEANGSSTTTTTTSKVASTGSTDMRPDWAKSASQADVTASAEPQPQAVSSGAKTQSTDSSAPASSTANAAEESSDDSSPPITLKTGSAQGAGYIGAAVRTAPTPRNLPSRYCGGYDEKASEKYRIAKRGMFKEGKKDDRPQEPPALQQENVVPEDTENKDVIEKSTEKLSLENNGPAAAATSVNVVAPMPPQQPSASSTNAPPPSASASTDQMPPTPNSWSTGSPAAAPPPPPQQAQQQYVPTGSYPHPPQTVIAKGYGDEQRRAMYYPQGGSADNYRHTHPAEPQAPPSQQHGNRMYDSRGSAEMFNEYDRNYRKDQPQGDWNRPPSGRYANDPEGMGWYEHPQQQMYRNNYGSGWQQPMPPTRYPPQGSQQNGTAAWYSTAVPGPQIMPVDQRQMRGAYQPQQGAPQVLQRRSSQSDLDQSQDYIIDEPSRALQQGTEREAAIERSRQKRRVGNDYRSQQQGSFEVDNSYGGQWNGPPKESRHQERSGKTRGSNRRSDGSEHVSEGFKVLQRPPNVTAEERQAAGGVPSINDEEESEIQLKKLPKSGRITKRDTRKQSEKKAASEQKNADSPREPKDASENRDDSPVKPAPAPVDNVWERRLEERVSAEREKEQQLKQQQQQNQPPQSKGHRKEARQYPSIDSKIESSYYEEEGHRSSKRGGNSRRGAPGGTFTSRGGSRGSFSQKSKPAESQPTQTQPDFGDNFSNMGEFHVEDTMLDAPVKARKSTKTRGTNGIIHRGSGRRVLLPDPVDVKRTSPESQDQQPRPLKDAAQRGRRGVAARGKIRGGMSSLTTRKPSRNVSRQYQQTIDTESVGEEAPASSSVPTAASSDRGSMLKSPVNSSEGCGEEWETASESSGVISKPSSKEVDEKTGGQPVIKSASSSSVPSRKASSAKSEKPEKANTQRQAGPKNAKPASHTSLVRGASSSKNNFASKNSTKTERTGRSASASNARDSGTKISTSTGLNNKDGLAGVDINNASVVVIDDHPATLDVASTTDEGFVEVLSKAAKRQRQQEEQAKAEAEKKKAQKEKERQEKLQAKKEKAAAKAPGKKSDKQTKKDKPSKASDSEADPSTNSRIVKKEGLIKTVWNSDVVPPTPEESLRGALPVIPSPIARPTPKQAAKAAEADAALTVVTKTPEPVAPKEEDTFSPTGNKASGEGGGGESEDDGTKSLKQKVDKVKEIWKAQRELSNTLQSPTPPHTAPPVSSAAQGPNVAKVRPQPQSTTDVVSPVVQKEQPQQQAVAPQQQHAPNNAGHKPAAPSPAQVSLAHSQAAPVFPNQNAHYQPLMQTPSPFGGITMPPYSVMFNGDMMHPATTNSPPAQNLFGPIPFNAHPHPANQRPVAQPVPPPSRGSGTSSNFEMGPFFPAANLPSWSTNELTTPPPATPQRFFNSAAPYSMPPPNKAVVPPPGQRPNFNQPPPPLHPFGIQPGLPDFANKQPAQRLQGPPQPLHNFGNNFAAPPPQPNYRYGPPPPAMFGNDAVWSANPKDALPTQPPPSYGLFPKPPPVVPTSGYGAAPMMPGRNDRWNYSTRGPFTQQPHHQFQHTKENVFADQHNGRASAASTSSGANNKPTSKA
ncbi:hypothetical protein QR680_016096 [Steinernema hermaphroditum]|uniref:BAT2 N-terminal domain-containing protein n=1 Tax=Steinernema hermaphroditum TaxID=289476 RepID=A0AA39HAA7_9BILA|nr:hypothetical protein QR680_016096 [Steinernema hermaphroditum]